jgi:hypothetical protein
MDSYSYPPPVRDILVDGIKQPVPFDGYHVVIAAWLKKLALSAVHRQNLVRGQNERLRSQLPSIEIFVDAVFGWRMWRRVGRKSDVTPLIRSIL